MNSKSAANFGRETLDRVAKTFTKAQAQARDRIRGIEESVRCAKATVLKQGESFKDRMETEMLHRTSQVAHQLSRSFASIANMTAQRAQQKSMKQKIEVVGKPKRRSR